MSTGSANRLYSVPIGKFCFFFTLLVCHVLSQLAHGRLFINSAFQVLCFLLCLMLPNNRSKSFGKCLIRVYSPHIFFCCIVLLPIMTRNCRHGTSFGSGSPPTANLITEGVIQSCAFAVR